MWMTLIDAKRRRIKSPRWGSRKWEGTSFHRLSRRISSVAFAPDWIYYETLPSFWKFAWVVFFIQRWWERKRSSLSDFKYKSSWSKVCFIRKRKTWRTWRNIKYISRETFEYHPACVYVYHFILIDQNFSIISRENKNISSNVPRLQRENSIDR